MAFGRSKMTLLPGEQYPLPLDKDHPSQTNSPKYPREKEGGIWDEEVREGEGRFSEDGPAAEEEGLKSSMTMSSMDGVFAWPLVPFDARAAADEATGTEDGMAEVVVAAAEEVGARAGSSSSESEEGKKRSGSDLDSGARTCGELALISDDGEKEKSRGC